MKKQLIYGLSVFIFAAAVSGEAAASPIAGSTKAILPNVREEISGPTAGASNVLLKALMDSKKEIQVSFSKNQTSVSGSVETEEDIDIEDTAVEDVVQSAEQDEYRYVLSHPDNVPNETKGCKSYVMSYEHRSAIKAVDSPQYEMCFKTASVDKDGFLRVGERYVVAVGTAYADKVGDKIDILYKDGTLVKAIVGDFKSDRHTDPTHRFHLGWYGNTDGTVTCTAGQCTAENGYAWHSGDGSVIEFIVDSSRYKKTLPFFIYDENPVMKVVKID